jgi:hypothetical protein
LERPKTRELPPTFPQRIQDDLMQSFFASGSPQADAAFAGAAARFFELLKTFAAQPHAPAGQSPDWTSFGATLASQFEQWLRSAPAAGAAFAAAAGFPAGTATWPPGPVPLGPGAAPAAAGEGAWELLMKLGQLQAQLAQHWSEIARSATELFMTRMRSSGRGDFSSENALALYQAWVDCAEEAYAATVRKEEFCHLQAQLTNTAMALLLAQRRQAESLARAWGLPTREEADALRQQLEERAAQPAARTARSAKKRRPKATAGGGARRRRGAARRGRR